MAISKTRATVTLTEDVHEAVQTAAAAAGLTVPDYIRRALAFQAAISRYITDDNVLTVVDPAKEREVHVQLVGV
jgi:hypothetical protein